MFTRTLFRYWIAGGALCLALPSWAAAEDFVDMLPESGLQGWIVEPDARHVQLEQDQPNWTNRDGLLHCAGRGDGFLRYETEVCDFVWRLEYRVTKGCNSGIGIRSIPFDGRFQTRPSVRGYEIQILDDAGKPATTHSSGSLYRFVAPHKNAARAAGEWNQMQIECRGPQIKITLNGEVIQDLDQSETARLKSKPLCGYLSLQNHGREVEFRNLQLKILQPAAPQ